MAVKSYDCNSAPGLLNLKEGEEVIEENDSTRTGWKKVRKNETEEGFVPTNCLMQSMPNNIYFKTIKHNFSFSIWEAAG